MKLGASITIASGLTVLYRTGLRRRCGKNGRLWERRLLGSLGKLFEFPTFPQARRRQTVTQEVDLIPGEDYQGVLSNCRL